MIQDYLKESSKRFHLVNVVDGYVYEFGVYGGRSLLSLLTSLLSSGNKVRGVFGFDSFEGLPPTTDPLEQKIWKEGDFNIQKILLMNKEESLTYLRSQFCHFHFPVNIIPGWFADSLNEFNLQKFQMGKASVVHIDCDLYSSTYVALDFLFKNNLVQTGTIFCYDDWFIPNTNDFDTGESKAHKEIEQKYDLKFNSVDKHIFKLL